MIIKAKFLSKKQFIILIILGGAILFLTSVFYLSNSSIQKAQASPGTCIQNGWCTGQNWCLSISNWCLFTSGVECLFGNFCPPSGTVTGSTCYYQRLGCNSLGQCNIKTCTLGGGQTCDSTWGCGGGCSCGSWTNAGCGQGGCAANQQRQTRSCTPAGCNSEGRCVADSSCAAPPDCSSCAAWVDKGCGGAGCASNEIGFTRTCPVGCQEWKCVADTSCGPLCNCGSWANGNCAEGGCSSIQRRQVRSCAPAGCSNENQCVDDSSCVPPPPPPDCHTGYGAGVLSSDQKIYVWNQLISELPENIANIFYWQVIPQESSWNASVEALCSNCYGIGLYQLEDATRPGGSCSEYHRNCHWTCQTPHAINVYKTRGPGYWQSWP